MAAVLAAVAITCRVGGPARPGPVFAEPLAANSDEYIVKAAFIYQFANFIDWPAEAFAPEQQEFRVCIVGDDPFGSILEETFDGRRVEGRPIVVTRANPDDDLDSFQMVFVARSERERNTEILRRLRGRAVVTIGETSDFAGHGGMISFFLDGHHVRFEVNPMSFEGGGLYVSSQVLKLARIVSGDGN